jgi:light-regulated signal transduction histidine kinase (bacteriophytochrome)
MSETFPQDQTPDMSRQGPAYGAVDLTTCDKEPIHSLGAVQPHGALVALDPETLRVVHAGGDTMRVLGVAPADLLGQSIEALLPPDRVARLWLLMVDGGLPVPLHAFVVPAKRDGQDFDAIVHFSVGLAVLEFEPLVERAPDDVMGVVQVMLLHVQQAVTSRSLCQAIVDQVRRVSGFDRVMLYRFLADGSGVVDAEARDDISESFLGLHFPSSDIPRQARALYLKNFIRLIPDVRATPAPIVPLVNPGNGQPLDLSFSVIRSVSPIHLEYLANMGVAGSMSLSIIMGGKLWGLIACHHNTPRFLPFRLRTACEYFAQAASSKLETKVAAEYFEPQLHSKRIQEELVKNMSEAADLAEGLTGNTPNLLDYIPADGVGLWLDDRFTPLGQTPTIEQTAALVGWLNETVADGVFCTDRLPLVYPPAEAFADVASGLIALSVSKSRRDYVLWFRPEFVGTVTWAGNPEKPVEIGPNGDRLTPRKSFAAWREAVRLQSRPWQNTEIEAARILRVSLLEVVLRRIDQVAREREKARLEQEALTQIENERRRTEDARAELLHVARLSNMSDVAAGLAHEVSQPLTAILAFASVGRRALSSTTEPSVARVIEVIETQARNATDILKRLRGFIEKREIQRYPENLAKLIEDALALASVRSNGGRMRVVSKLSRDDIDVNVDRVQIIQVLVNFMRNASDATADQSYPEVVIETMMEKPSVVRLDVSDNGPGVDPKVADRLFKPFVTTKSSGMGIGLSLCKTIIESHNGEIGCAVNTPKGASFWFTLPIIERTEAAQ